MDIFCRNGRSPIQAVVVDLKGLSHASVLELARTIRKISTLQALPVLALALSLSTTYEKQLKEAGISHIVHKPLRYSTLAAVLLETIGVPAKASTKKVNVNSKMLSGRKLLVVIIFLSDPNHTAFAFFQLSFLRKRSGRLDRLPLSFQVCGSTRILGTSVFLRCGYEFNLVL